MAHDTDVLVDAQWLEDRLDAAAADDSALRVLEIESPNPPDDDFPSRYDEGHVPGAIGLRWDRDLSDDVQRDVLTKADFEELLGENGITEDSTVVLYGDGHIPNWFAVFAYWEFRYYGHEDVRVLDGGKDYWVEAGYELTTAEPEVTPVEYTASGPHEPLRAYAGDVERAQSRDLPLVDVRSPEEFTGELIAPEGLRETAQRGGHIPGASNVPVRENLREDGRFKSAADLEALYADHGIEGSEPVITYCRVGERSAIAWFVLQELLGYDSVTNYDGSWTEWGNRIGAPIATGGAD